MSYTLDEKIELENRWEKRLKKQLNKTPKQWLKIFPEVDLELINSKIDEWREKETKLKSDIAFVEKQLNADHKEIKISGDIFLFNSMGPNEKMFCRAYLQETLGKELEEVSSQISRLMRYQWALNPQNRPDDALTDAQIEAAKSVEIMSLLPNRDWKKAGGNYKCLCPFHDEKTPSFQVFQDNHYHCFGCGRHGDAINLVMELEKLTFKQAVRYLTNGKVVR